MTHGRKHLYSSFSHYSIHMLSINIFYGILKCYPRSLKAPEHTLLKSPELKTPMLGSWNLGPLSIYSFYHKKLTNRDRKSTRLNSSHSQISYAVFCLKKKTKATKKHTQRHKSLTYVQ